MDIIKIEFKIYHSTEKKVLLLLDILMKIILS
jgi:hypothetical protein